MIICKICNKEFENAKELTKHLVNEHEYKLEQIYNYYNYSFETGNAICPVCGKEFIMTRRQVLGYDKDNNKSIGCSAFCSKALIHVAFGSPLANKEIREKIKQTNLERYGTEQVLASKEVRNKISKTNLKKYGTENIGSVKEVQEKIRQTNLERYGVIFKTS